MNWLNYHHLLYFYMAARLGSVSKAAAELRLAQPTISGQIRALEDSLGEKLFQRAGRRLVLTETGQAVYRYADEIFHLGRELVDMVHGNPTGRPGRLVVGVADAMPKLIAYRLIEPALRLPDPVRVVCREGQPDRLIAELAIHQVDVVLSDAPAPTSVRVRAFNHLLGECGVSFFAAPDLAKGLKPNFPHSLSGAPFLLPSDNSVLRRSLEQWFHAKRIHPGVVNEFDDSALLKVFGQGGAGVFAAPTPIAHEVQRQHAVDCIGATDEIKERFYAITVEKRITNPAVAVISSSARKNIFA